MESAEKAELR